MKSRAYLDWIKEQPCLLCSTTYEIDPHHLKNGDKSRRLEDVGNVVPLCRYHHEMITKFPDKEREFEEMFYRVAKLLENKWEEKCH